MTRLKCSDTGEWIDLGKEISKSGEGSIYKTNKAGFLAKIYHNHTITQEKIDKLQVMVKNPPADPTRSQGHVSIAWPKCVLQDSYGKSLGFLMPAISNGQTLINVYNPKLRQKKALGFNWFYLHTTAMNIASIIQAIHGHNYVVGDLKPDNLLVTPNACASIIDTDSFQIVDRRTGKIYRSPVASQEYTPPEMFRKDLQKVDRSEFQDRFALGVIIWHLLFGYHPFSGQWSGSGNQPNIDELIELGYWMYGSTSKLRPRQHSIPLNIIHPELQKLFYKCFNDGHNKPYARPSAADWQKALRVAISELTQCSVERGHHYAKSYGKCYWCERKRQLNYDMFASPAGMSQTTVSLLPPLTFPISPLPVFAPTGRITPPPIKPANITDKIKSFVGLGVQAVAKFSNPRLQQRAQATKITDTIKWLISRGVIVLILLFLAAIALPSFLNQSSKAKQAEAKQYVASMNKAQQAFFTKKTSFASKISDLGSGIKSETINYKYQMYKFLNNNFVVVAVAQPKVSGIKGYVGIVFATKTNIKLPGVTTSALLCELSQASTSLPNLSTIISKNPKGNIVVQCPSGYNRLALTQNSQPQLSPQQVVQRYYQLAPSNREGAKALLSDAYKNWSKQNNADSAGASFWNSINKVEVYQLANLSHSQNNYKIKIWLKYLTKDGTQPCESQEVEVILDRSKAQWLIDRTNNIEQKPDCGR